MGQLRGGDPDAMESLATKAKNTAATVAAIRTLLDRVRENAPVYGELEQKMSDEFEARLLPRISGAEGALGNVAEVLTWNAQDQRHASDASAPSPTGAKPEYRTPSPGQNPLRAAKFAQAQVPVTIPEPAGGPTFTGGVPFSERVSETRTKIEGLLTAERTRQAELQRLYDRSRETGDAAGFGDRAALGESKRLIQHYESLLQPDRQILYYDPKGDGALVEVHGKIGAGTENIAVLVPGMTIDQYSTQDSTLRAKDFVTAADGKLAVVVALLGDHPDKLIAAVSPSYAAALGRPLAELTHAVRVEAGNQGAGEAKLSVVGHSYGASIVGEGEKRGLSADRILGVAPAGVGHGVATPADLAPANPAVRRYSMTAPGDPIQFLQGLEAGGWGHGRADPDKFPGTLELCTGSYPNDPALGLNAGRPVFGPEAHSSIWTKGSDSWKNAFGVMTGSEVRPAVYPEPIIVPGPDGEAFPYQPPPVCGPAIDIE